MSQSSVCTEKVKDSNYFDMPRYIDGIAGGRKVFPVEIADASSLVSRRYMATWRRMVEFLGPRSCCTAGNVTDPQ